VNPVAPEVRAGGRLLTGPLLEALVEMRAERGLRTVGTITLRFTDPGYQLASSSSFSVGSLIEVRVAGGGELARGSVTGIAVEQRDGLPPELVVTAHDQVRRLAGSPKMRAFIKSSLPSVLTGVLAESGLSGRFAPASDVHEHVLQVGTDLEFLDEVADRLSWDWWLDGTTVIAQPPGRGPKVTRALGDDLQEFSAGVVDVPTGVKVSGWNPWKKEITTTSVIRVDGAEAAATAPLIDKFTHQAKSADAPAAPERTVHASRTLRDGDEARAVAGSLRDAIARGAVTARGRGPADAAMLPGTTLQVTNAGPLAGTYYITAVEHVYRRSGFHTRFVAGDRSPATLVDLLGGRQEIGHGHTDLGPRYHGLMVGLITSIKDPEKRGRVKLKFPALSDTLESDWARVATLGAGKGRGLVVLPEVDDEVLVGFEGGDLRRPVILAGLHNQKDSIPQHDVEHGVAHRRFTSKLGHVIELADGAQDADQHVLIALAGGQHLIRLGKDRTDVKLPDGVPMSITVGTTTIAVDKRNGLTIEADDVSVTARRKLTLSGHDVEIKATAKLATSATVLESKATGMATLESDGITTVKGKAVAIN
jgi:uncharacterized protein involved in type VI secretion and phage assembly